MVKLQEAMSVVPVVKMPIRGYLHAHVCQSIWAVWSISVPLDTEGPVHSVDAWLIVNV